MELRHLRYFVAVAEELHFIRAAERLGLKQPPLSLQIRQLETELGTLLFHRLTRGVELTEAGAALLEDARRILAQVAQAKANAQSHARGEIGRVQVGFAGATYFQPRVPVTIRAFRERYPGVQLSPHQSNTPRLLAGLRAGEIDVAFVRPPIGDGDGLVVHPLIDEPMLVALPITHPLAERRAIPMESLANETLILFPRTIGPGLYDEIIASCQRAGFSPKLGQEAPQISSIVYMVAAGFGVAIVPRSLEQIHAEGIRYLPIEGDGPRASIGLAYRRDNRAQAVRNFVELARHSEKAPVRREVRGV